MWPAGKLPELFKNKLFLRSKALKPYMNNSTLQIKTMFWLDSQLA